MTTGNPIMFKGAMFEFLIKIQSISVAVLKRNGELGQPCLTPSLMGNLGDVPPGGEIELFASS